MDYNRKNQRIANSYYNLGLEKAKMRDLTGAADCLKKSLHFYKGQTDARNLLGLIYYEVGEVADALVQWVISMNLQPEENRADYYLGQIQRKPGRLEVESQSIKKYNQALWHAQNGSDDLAILQLTRVVEAKPNFVKAHLLLAVLFMAHEDFPKAGKSLYKVLQIDRNNPKAQYFMAIVKSNTGRAEIERRKLTNAFSHKQMQDDDVILPPSYKENTGWQMIFNIVTGLVLGVAAFFFLVLPANTKALNEAHNKEMVEYSDQLNTKNLEIDRLNQQITSLQSEKETAEASLSQVMSDSGGILAQYETLIRVLQAQSEADLTTAASLYAGLDTSVFTEESILSILSGLQTTMQAEGYQALASAGDQAVEAGNWETALDHYQKSLTIKGDNPEVIFHMAQVYKQMGDTEQANQLFGEVIMSYPDCEFVDQAKEERGY
ncbi:MAG: tetratricopeptide repeat protein [Lachnospiraceae bacterium]